VREAFPLKGGSPPPSTGETQLSKRVLLALIALATTQVPTLAQTRPAATIPGAVQPQLGAPVQATPAPSQATPVAPALGPTASATVGPDTFPTLPPVKPFAVTARSVRFYYNRFTLVADGDVHLRLPDGTDLRGNTFSMDLRLDRFLIAGDVTLTRDGVVQHGAAFSKFLDFDRGYFIPITTEPDRWTFVGTDYAHPLRGRDMPGDTFALPDTTGERAFIQAKKVVISPRESARFTPALIALGPANVAFPTYFLNFTANPNFAQNSLAGAQVDAPYPFAGGKHTLATAHVRYDSANRLYGALEYHVVGDHSYIVASGNPLTRPQKQYNLLAQDVVSKHLQIQGLLQENAFQHSFTQPLSASGYANFQATIALAHSFIQANSDFYYDSLLAQPKPGFAGQLYYGDLGHPYVPNHPMDATVSWTGFTHQVNKVPLFYRLRSGYGFAHDGISGVPSINGADPHTVFYKFGGITAYTPSFHVLRDKHRPNTGDVLFNGSVDKQIEWFSLPHHTDVTTVNASLSKTFTPKLTAFFNYTNANTGDFYGANQSIAYPGGRIYSYTTGQTYDYAAFRGFGTTRSYLEQAVFQASPDLTVTASMRENDDFPRPVPEPATIGQIGATPLLASLDVRFRVAHNLLLDVGRTYSFGFGNQFFSPQFFIQALP